MKLYTVITADVIKSRKYPNINKLLPKKIDQIKYLSCMLVPFKISRGDEIQGVFQGVLASPEIIRQFRYFLLPYKLKIGIGVGKIDQEGNFTNSWEMNGSAFHYAREALEEVDGDTLFLTRIKSSDKKADEVINTILLLIDTIQSHWTPAQWEAVYYYETEGTYKKAAEILNIAFQNVEKRCRAANWKKIQVAEKTILNISQKKNFL